MPRTNLFIPFRHRWAYFIVTLHILGLLYVAFGTQFIFKSRGSESLQKVPGASRVPFHSIIHGLDAFRHSITAPNLTLTSRETFLLPYPSSPDGHRFQKSLGKKILILDVDTRSMNQSGEILNSTWAPNERNLWPTAGRLNHYLFAQLHGYDYKFMQTSNLPGKFGTWSKVSALKEQLYQYEFVVFVDADTIFPYPHVPLEWLFNYWDIIPENLVAMAIDPPYPINNDLRGRTMLNTGFIIAQRGPRAHELFAAWESCPSDVEYLGCSNFSYNWPHEQGAFGNFIRYDFNRPDDVRILKCAEANGCPEVSHLGCPGKLVRHYWGSKASVPFAVKESIVQYFLLSLHGEFHQNYADIVSYIQFNLSYPSTAVRNSPSVVGQTLRTETSTPVQEDSPKVPETPLSLGDLNPRLR